MYKKFIATFIDRLTNKLSIYHTALYLLEVCLMKFENDHVELSSFSPIPKNNRNLFNVGLTKQLTVLNMLEFGIYL